MSSNKISKERFDLEVKNWKTSNKQRDIIGWERIRRLNILKNLLKKYSNQNINILEIGCGAGNNISEIAKQNPNWNCVGVDISSNMVNFCKKEYEKITNLSFSELNIDKKILEQKFDVICLLGVIGYIENNKLAFKNIDSMLKKNGEIYFTYGNKYSLFRFIRESSSNLLDKLPVLIKTYNSFKKNVLKNNIKYNPQANRFKSFTRKQIVKSLPNNYKISEEFNICFSAGIFGNMSVKLSKPLEKIFFKKDYFNLCLTKIMYLTKK